MTPKPDKPPSGFPSAKELMARLATVEADKASEAMRRQAKADAEKKALIDRLSKPSGVSDDQAMEKVQAMLQRAIQNGQTQIQVYRFPNTMCTDGGRAINQQERDFPKTLTGVPKEIYEFWQRKLRPLGYKLQYQIIEFPGGVPGDVGVILKWD
jgi:hypothetical protein